MGLLWECVIIQLSHSTQGRRINCFAQKALFNQAMGLNSHVPLFLGHDQNIPPPSPPTHSHTNIYWLIPSPEPCSLCCLCPTHRQAWQGFSPGWAQNTQTKRHTYTLTYRKRERNTHILQGIGLHPSKEENSTPLSCFGQHLPIRGVLPIHQTSVISGNRFLFMPQWIADCSQRRPMGRGWEAGILIILNVV